MVIRPTARYVYALTANEREIIVGALLAVIEDGSGEEGFLAKRANDAARALDALQERGT